MNLITRFILALVLVMFSGDSLAGVPQNHPVLSRNSPPHSCIYLYAHGNPVNGIDPSGHFEMNVTGLFAGMTIGGYLTSVGGSYVAGKVLDVGMQLAMFGEWSQVEVDVYEHWDLLNLIPGFAIERTWSKMATYLRKLKIVGKHKGAITEARKAVPVLAETGFRECEVVSATLAEKLGTGAVTRPRLAGKHWVTEFEGVVYDLSAGQYVKYLSKEALEDFALALGTGVFEPAHHDEFMRLVDAALQSITH